MHRALYIVFVIEDEVFKILGAERPRILNPIDARKRQQLVFAYRRVKNKLCAVQNGIAVFRFKVASPDPRGFQSDCYISYRNRRVEARHSDTVILLIKSKKSLFG